MCSLINHPAIGVSHSWNPPICLLSSICWRSMAQCARTSIPEAIIACPSSVHVGYLGDSWVCRTLISCKALKKPSMREVKYVQIMGGCAYEDHSSVSISLPCHQQFLYQFDCQEPQRIVAQGKSHRAAASSGPLCCARKISQMSVEGTHQVWRCWGIAKV